MHRGCRRRGRWKKETSCPCLLNCRFSNFGPFFDDASKGMINRLNHIPLYSPFWWFFPFRWVQNSSRHTNQRTKKALSDHIPWDEHGHPPKILCRRWKILLTWALCRLIQQLSCQTEIKLSPNKVVFWKTIDRPVYQSRINFIPEVAKVFSLK